MPQEVFKPEHMAREMLELYPELASEIVLRLLDDAMMIGESTRARLWWDVLVSIGRMREDERVRVH